MLLKSKESKVVFVALTQHLMQTCESLIVTHVTQVERVESGVCGSYTTPCADV